jgi:hypothetical protein
MAEGLTDDQLAALKEWGEGLAGVEQVELQAAGRAIGLLIREIEALQRQAWHQQLALPAEVPEVPESRSLAAALAQRLARRPLV